MHEAFVTNCLDSISWIKISVNGGDEETYNHVHQAKKGDWKTLWENITFATSYRNIQGLQTAIGIQIVVIPENVESLEDLLLESKLAGVDYVVIKPYSQHLSSMETAKKYSGLEYNSGETFAKLKEKFEDETFSIVVRNNAIAETGHSYDRCYSTPNFWAYLMSNGDLYSCSAYLLDNRFNLGNINESTFQAIWEGEKRKKNIELVENHLDINECRVNCRMNQVNKYLWELKNPPSHLSFI